MRRQWFVALVVLLGAWNVQTAIAQTTDLQSSVAR